MMNRLLLDEILTEVEEYLNNVLSKEKLSKNGEGLRKKLLQKIEVSKLPPILPPRPPEVNDNDHIARQREISRESRTANANLHINIKDDDICPGEFIPGEEYEDVVDMAGKGNKSVKEPETPDDVYEQPQNNGAHNHSDSGSNTSYESYDDFTDTDEDMGDDNNINTRHVKTTEHIQLPNDDNVYCNVPIDAGQPTQSKIKREKNKRKKKKKKELPFSKLENVIYSGELYQRAGLLQSLSKRTCVISDNRLVVYKTESDLQPNLLVPLLGYEVIYLERDGKYNHMLKLTRAGCDTHWLYADNKQTANMWEKYLTSACTRTAPPSITDSGYSTEAPTRDSTISSQSTTGLMCSSTEVGHSSSEGGSGDGVVLGPATETTPSDNKPKDTAASKNVLSSLGSLLKSTIGRKKGEKAANLLESLEFEDDPEVILSGHVNVMSDVFFTGNKKWYKRYCHIKNHTLECFKERGAESQDFSLPLNGVMIESGGMTGKHELALKLIQDGTTKLFFEPTNTVDQGTWLSILIKETGCASPKAKPPSDDISDGEEYSDIQELTPAPPLMKKVTANNQTNSPRGTPPPLPKNPPPIRTPPSIKRVFGDFALEKADNLPEEEYDDVLVQGDPSDDDSLYKNVEINSDQVPKTSLRYPESNNGAMVESGYADSGLDNRRKAVESGSDKDQLMADDHAYIEAQASEATYDDVAVTPKRQVGEIITRIKSRLVEEATTPKYKSVIQEEAANPDVIKCQTGPTIAEDQELLQKTQNPLLIELRKGKAKKDWNNDELEKLKDQIYEKKQTIFQMRRQRTEIRSKKLRCKSTEKEKFEQQLQDLDKQMEEGEQELTKLQVIAQEHPSNSSRPVSRNSSFNSGRNSNPVSRNTSFNSKPSTPITSPRSTTKPGQLNQKDITTKRISTISTRLSGVSENKALQDGKAAANVKNTNSDLPWKKTTTKASTLPANIQPVKSWTNGKSTPPKRTSPTGFGSSRGWKSDRSNEKFTRTKSTTKATVNTTSKVTSKSLELNSKPKVTSKTNIRDVKNAADSTGESRFTSRARPELTKRLSQTNSPNTGPRTPSGQTATGGKGATKNVITPTLMQDKLKLWEAKVADSNC